MALSSRATVLAALLFFVSTSFVSAVPTNVTVNYPTVYYCPFDVSTAISQDLSSLDVTYAVPQPGSSPSTNEEAACYVAVPLNYTPIDSIEIREIEYKADIAGDGSAQVEAKLVWDGNFGPTHFTPVIISKGSSGKVSSNSTMVMGADCGAQLEYSEAKLHLRTTFKSPASGLAAGQRVTQKLKLTWNAFPCDRAWDPCTQADVDGTVRLECTAGTVGAAAISEAMTRPDRNCELAEEQKLRNIKIYR